MLNIPAGNSPITPEAAPGAVPADERRTGNIFKDSWTAIKVVNVLIPNADKDRESSLLMTSRTSVPSRVFVTHCSTVSVRELASERCASLAPGVCRRTMGSESNNSRLLGFELGGVHLLRCFARKLVSTATRAFQRVSIDTD